MRIRNNKVNVFLSDDEKFILKRASSKLNLSQSEYIRNLIVGYEIKIPIPPKEPKPKIKELGIDVIRALDANINCLMKVKDRFHYLGYFNDEEAIKIKIEALKVLNNSVIKNLANNKNDKDNVE